MPSGGLAEVRIHLDNGLNPNKYFLVEKDPITTAKLRSAKAAERDDRFHKVHIVERDLSEWLAKQREPFLSSSADVPGCSSAENMQLARQIHVTGRGFLAINFQGAREKVATKSAMKNLAANAENSYASFFAAATAGVHEQDGSLSWLGGARNQFRLQTSTHVPIDVARDQAAERMWIMNVGHGREESRFNPNGLLDSALAQERRNVASNGKVFHPLQRDVEVLATLAADFSAMALEVLRRAPRLHSSIEIPPAVNTLTMAIVGKLFGGVFVSSVYRYSYHSQVGSHSPYHGFCAVVDQSGDLLPMMEGVGTFALKAILSRATGNVAGMVIKDPQGRSLRAGDRITGDYQLVVLERDKSEPAISMKIGAFCTQVKNALAVHRIYPLRELSTYNAVPSEYLNEAADLGAYDDTSDSRVPV